MVDEGRYFVTVAEVEDRLSQLGKPYFCCTFDEPGMPRLYVGEHVASIMAWKVLRHTGRYPIIDAAWLKGSHMEVRCKLRKFDDTWHMVVDFLQFV